MLKNYIIFIAMAVSAESDESIKTDLFFDLERERMPSRDDELADHSGNGTDSVNILPLGVFLRRHDLDIRTPLVTSGINQNSPEVNRWTRESALDAVRWLLSILPDPSDPNEKIINKEILIRAARLGLVPGPRIIRRLFGSYTNLYIALEEINTRRIFFNEYDDERLLDYVRRRIDELGRNPTADEFRQYAREDPSVPSYDFIHKQLGGVVLATEKAGALTPVNWSNERRVLWGVEYCLANEGRQPSMASTRILSPLDKGPSYRSIFVGFGSETAYDRLVSFEYEKAAAMLDGPAGSSSLPKELMGRVQSLSLRAMRYVRWGLASNYIDDEAFRRAVVAADLPDKDFLDMLKGFPSWDETKFEEMADSYEGLRNAWRYDYLQSLKLENAVKALLDIKRGVLSQRDQEVMEGSIGAITESLGNDGISQLKQVRLASLVKEGLVPEGAYFDYIFGSLDNLRTMISSRLNSIEENPELVTSRRRARLTLDNLVGRSDDEIALRLPAGFIGRIQELEHLLQNPPPLEQQIREIGWWNT